MAQTFLGKGFSCDADAREAEELKASPGVVFGLARVFAKELYDVKLFRRRGGGGRINSADSPKGLII